MAADYFKNYFIDKLTWTSVVSPRGKQSGVFIYYYAKSRNTRYNR